MTGRPGHWSEPGEYNILFLGSVLVISSQDSSALGYREFTQKGAMTIGPFAAKEGTSGPQWQIVKKCCRHLVPSSDFFVRSYAVPKFHKHTSAGLAAIVMLGVLPGVPFSQAPQKSLLVDFGRQEYGYQTSWSRFGVHLEPYLNSTLGSV